MNSPPHGLPWLLASPSMTDDPIGTSDMTSDPPAITMSMVPDMTACDAIWNACADDPHCGSTVVPGTDSGRVLDDSTTLRPRLAPCAPTCDTQPHTTSLMSAAGTFARFISSSTTTAPRSAGCHWLSEPLRFPPAVRTHSTMYAFIA